MHYLISYGLIPTNGNNGKPGIGIKLELRSLGAVGITIFRAFSVDSEKLYC